MQLDKDTPILTITDRASERIKEILKNAEKGVIGLRVGIRTAGCSGLQYNVEFASEQKEFEDSINVNGVRVLIDPAAVMFLIGSWVKRPLWSTGMFLAITRDHGHLQVPG